MDDTNPRVERTGQRLTFAAGLSPAIQIAGLASLAGSVLVFASGYADAFASNTAGMVSAFVAIACILLAISALRWILEVDLATRRLRLTRQFLNLQTKTIVDCSFDDCRALGTFKSNVEGQVSHSAYFQLVDGQTHAIPLDKTTFAEAAKVARELSMATGIPLAETPT